MKHPHGKNPRSHLSGAAHPLAKLTAEKVDCMRAMKKRRCKIKDIAKCFGVSIGTASKAINGKTWK